MPAAYDDCPECYTGVLKPKRDEDGFVFLQCDCEDCGATFDTLDGQRSF